MDPFDSVERDPVEGEATQVVPGGSGRSRSRLGRTMRVLGGIVALAALVAIGTVFGPIPRDESPDTVHIVQPTDDPTGQAVPSLAGESAPPTPEGQLQGNAGTDPSGPAPSSDVPSPKPIAPNDRLEDPVVSADGRYVAFNSLATNLVPGDPDLYDVFVYDRETRELEIASLDDDGKRMGGVLGDISADGRYVLFVQGAVMGEQLYVRDRVRARTILASVSNSGEPQNSHPFTWGPNTHSISSDGRFVAFRSSATNLVPGDTNNLEDAFVRDIVAGITTRVSESSSGKQTDAGISDQMGVEISGNGRYVIFGSFATDLVEQEIPTCTSGNSEWPCGQIYGHDRETSKTSIASVDESGAVFGDAYSGASISDDGRFIVFEAYPVDHSGDGVRSYLRDRHAGSTMLIADAGYPWISGNGAFAAIGGNVLRLATGEIHRLDATSVTHSAFLGDARLIVFTDSDGRIRLHDWTTRTSEPVI